MSTITKPRPLINRTAVRTLILRRLEHLRPGLELKLTRVSEGSLDHLEARLQNMIDRELLSHPTVGSTIRIGGQ